jgi:hypothetical protein
MSESGEELRRAKVRTLRALREQLADRQSSRSQAPPQAINPPSATLREPPQRHQTVEQQNAWPLNRRVRIAGRAALLRDASEGNSGEALRRIASMNHASEAGVQTVRESVAAAVSNHGLPGDRGELGTTGFMRPNDTAIRPNTEAALLLELLHRVQGLTEEIVLLRADLIKQPPVRGETSAFRSVRAKRRTSNKSLARDAQLKRQK